MGYPRVNSRSGLLLEVLSHFQVLPHRDPRTRQVTREDSVIQCSMTLVLPHSHIGHRRFNAHELGSPHVIQNEGSRQPATTSGMRLWILQRPTRTNAEKKGLVVRLLTSRFITSAPRDNEIADREIAPASADHRSSRPSSARLSRWRIPSSSTSGTRGRWVPSVRSLTRQRASMVS